MTFQKRIAGAMALGMAMLIGGGLSVPSAQAGYVVTLEQVGLNVVATGSGPIDLTGLTFAFTNPLVPGIDGGAGLIFTGPAFVNSDVYSAINGPTSFGPPNIGEFVSQEASGDVVGVCATECSNVSTLIVPHLYVSDSPLSSTATYNNQTFANMGVTPGTYEWTWGTGANQNFTLDIKTAAVPEPSNLLLLALPLGLVMLLAARRGRANARAGRRSSSR